MKTIISVGALVAALSLVGCKTTGPVAKVDKTRGEMSLYTTSDSRSAMAAHTKTDDVKDVEEQLQQNVRGKQSNNVDTILNLAQIQLVQGKYKEAEQSCQKALRINLKSVKARKILAQIAIRRNNPAMAEILLNNIGGSKSKDSEVLNMMAMVALQKQENSRALSLFQRAIKVNPGDFAARMNYGVLLVKYRQLSQASVQFERILSAMPQHTDAKLHLAIVKAARGQTQSAQKMLEEVLDNDKKNPIALYNLAVIQQKTESYDDALDNLKVYLRSARGKSGDTDQVFALIDNIQRNRAARGEKVSDEDIQAMAASMSTVATDSEVATNQAPASSPEPVVEEEAKTEAAPEPVVDEPVADDIESLEAELFK